MRKKLFHQERHFDEQKTWWKECFSSFPRCFPIYKILDTWVEFFQNSFPETSGRMEKSVSARKMSNIFFKPPINTFQYSLLIYPNLKSMGRKFDTMKIINWPITRGNVDGMNIPLMKKKKKKSK